MHTGSPNQSLVVVGVDPVALRAWFAVAACSELARTIPSTGVLRNLPNQAVHVYAATDHLLDITLAGCASRQR